MTIAIRVAPSPLIGGCPFCSSVTGRIGEGPGGRIWDASEVGQGFRFYFTLPVATD